MTSSDNISITGAGETFPVAVVQASPVFLNREATIEKACARIAEAAQAGARLIAFPEAFVPGFPDWVWLPLPTGSSGVLHNELYAYLLAESVTIPGPATDRLCRAAREAGAWVVIGVNERNSQASGSSLYNTLLTIDAQGVIRGRHRKLVPTAGERLVWASGDGSTLQVHDTGTVGRLAGLICWENYMPLTRYALYAQGVQVYVAATWDCSETWLATLQHIAKEGGMYVLGCCTAMRNGDIPAHLPGKQEYYADDSEWCNIGNSAIVAPSGKFLAGPVQKEETILYAPIDPAEIASAKRVLDVAGHYARPDIFELVVRTDPRPLVRFTNGGEGGASIGGSGG